MDNMQYKHQIWYHYGQKIQKWTLINDQYGGHFPNWLPVTTAFRQMFILMMDIM